MGPRVAASLAMATGGTQPTACAFLTMNPSGTSFWISWYGFVGATVDRPVHVHQLLASRVLCAVQGDLSLLATGGNCGLPRGHIVAYQASHALHVEFAKALHSQQLLSSTS